MKKVLTFLLAVMFSICFVSVSHAVDVSGKVFTGDITVLGTAHVGTLITDNYSVWSGTGVIINGPTGVAVTYGVTAATIAVSGASALHAVTATTIAASGAVSGTVATFTSFAGINNTGPTIAGYIVATDSITLTASSMTVVECSKATPQQVTLPTAVGNTGLKFTFKKTGASTNIVKLLSNGSETIDGTISNSLIKTQYDYLTILSNGANWLIIDRYIQ